MKTILTLCIFLSLLSCKDANPRDSAIGTVQTSNLSAVVNGTAYNARFVSGVVSEITNTLVLTGAMGTGEDIQLFIPVTILEGVYSYELPIQGKYQATDDFENGGFAVSGRLDITAHDATGNHIKGTFNFVTKGVVTNAPSYVVENGKFDISY